MNGGGRRPAGAAYRNKSTPAIGRKTAAQSEKAGSRLFRIGELERTPAEGSARPTRFDRAKEDWGSLRPTRRELVPEVLAVVAAVAVAATRGSSLGEALAYALVAASAVVVSWWVVSFGVSWLRAPRLLVEDHNAVLEERLTERARVADAQAAKHRQVTEAAAERHRQEVEQLGAELTAAREQQQMPTSDPVTLLRLALPGQIREGLEIVDEAHIGCGEQESFVSLKRPSVLDLELLQKRASTWAKEVEELLGSTSHHLEHRRFSEARGLYASGFCAVHNGVEARVKVLNEILDALPAEEGGDREREMNAQFAAHEEEVQGLLDQIVTADAARDQAVISRDAAAAEMERMRTEPLRLLKAVYREGVDLRPKLVWGFGAPETPEESAELNRKQKNEAVEWGVKAWQILLADFQGVERRFFGSEAERAFGAHGFRMAADAAMKGHSPDSWIATKLAILEELIEKMDR